MKYFKLFDEQTAFDDTKSTVDRPNVAVVKESGDVFLTGRNANGHAFVDLGLSVRWATMNVGAAKETDCGYYFMWGETTPNITCSWQNYKYCDATAETTNSNAMLNKYYTSTAYGANPDNKTTLDLEDDAARFHMGGDWRMPTRTEIQELLNNTTNEWFDNFNGTGRKGYKFISKADTSKYIFIPASGERDGDNVWDTNLSCHLWSSSLSSSRFANNMYFLDPQREGNTKPYPYGDSMWRIVGSVVRGVLEF